MYRYTDAPEASPFERDRPTVLAYVALNCYAFWLYAFGPSLALLRDQLDFSYTLLGVYAAVWSGGAAVTGAVYPRLARRVPRGTLLWSSSAVASGGALLFVLGRDIATTLAGAAVLGLAGTTLLTLTQAILSDRHGDRRDRALTEANVIAGGCAVLAPLLLGVLVVAPGGWRLAFVVPMLVLGALFLNDRRRALPEPPPAPEHHDSRGLPLAARLFVGLVGFGVAVEFVVVYFGAERLRETGLTLAAAATAMSGYYVGLLLGRIAGAALTSRPGRTIALLHASLAVTLGGFLLFWLVDSPAVALVGLGLTGVGTANLYPLSLALALGAAPNRQDQANARSQLVGGVMVIVAPYLLGSLADHFDLTTAYAVMPVLLGLCLACLLAGQAAASRASARGVPSDHRARGVSCSSAASS